ncbi:MAG: HD domain-containing protein [Clostridia bacterium]|nr:HD domain-containing protein [Clostridia bacterium]
MKRWKLWQIVLFVALCILLNYGGRRLASHFDLPLWLDSFGTVLCAYAGGPLCGAIVGASSNLIYGMVNHISYIYALTSVALGLIAGFSARRGRMKTIFGTMSVAAQATVAAVVISVPLNVLFFEGGTGNLWGNGVIGYFREHGLPWLVSVTAGEFYIDFIDKQLTLLLMHVGLLLLWRVRGRRAKGEAKAGAEQLLGMALVCALLAGAPSAARAEGALAEVIDYNDYVQTVYSSNNGLPCGEANDIAQTNDGILWIGTYAGLYRYNGSEFRWMDSYESVRNVNCLYVDKEGRLWIGTNDNGLSICINEKIVNVVDQARGLPSNSVRAIVQSTDGYYYVGTTSSMQIMTLNSGLSQVSTLWEVNYANAIAADEDGHVAAITSDGRLFLMQKGRILSSIQLTDDSETFNTVCFDEDGVLLAGTSTNHIYVYEIDEGRFDEKTVRTCEGLNHINDLYYLDNGELFISADNGVGYISRDNDFEAVNTNSFNNSIDNMLIDYQGNLWFTSSRLGLLRMAPSAFKDVYSTVGMPNRVVNAVEKWQDCYYFGTDKGLDAVDALCKRRVNNALTEALEGVRIRCLLADSSDHLWICAYGSGLLEVAPDGTQYLYNRDNGSFGNRARVVAELSDGRIMAGGDTGISFIRDHEIVDTIDYADGLINSMILTVTELSDGTILAGTDGDGIVVLSPSGGIESMITRADGLSSEVILRTVKDPRTEGVFIVTSNGLCYMDADGAVRSLKNFPYFNNYDVWAKDDDTLFVMSSAGIYVVSRSDLLSGREDLSYDLLDARRGLNSALTANSWNYCDERGDLFLPCDTGVFIIDSARYSSVTSTYRMSVNSVRLDNVMQRVERDTPIEVGRGVSKIELYPEVINYTIQDPYVGYWLEGFESDWNIQAQSQLGTIVYTNLPTGDYTFHLAVFDNGLENILEEREYALTKAKEIYDNKWFTVYVLLVPMFAVAWLTWFLGRTRVQRTLELQRRELRLAHQQIQMGNETVIAIAKAVDAKDERTSQHSQRVSEYSVLIARELGFSEEELVNLKRAALMHDIGKIGIPDRILNKPARLTDDEYAIMKSHVTRGAEILKDFTLIDHVVEGARYHHERYDGRGYPDGLKSEDIPLYGRIIGVADAFDAMTANRIYRKQMDFEYVLNEMHNGRGTQFDPKIVDILLQLIDEGKIDLNALYPPKQDD